METSLLRAEIHEYVEQADERFLKLVYGMIKADHTDYELSEQEVKVIEERLFDYRNSPEVGKSWEDVRRGISDKS